MCKLHYIISFAEGQSNKANVLEAGIFRNI